MADSYDPYLMAAQIRLVTEALQVQTGQLITAGQVAEDLFKRLQDRADSLGEALERSATRGSAAFHTKFGPVEQTLTRIRDVVNSIGASISKVLPGIDLAKKHTGGMSKFLDMGKGGGTRQALGAVGGQLGVGGVMTGGIAGLVAYMLRSANLPQHYAAESQKVWQQLGQAGPVTQGGRLGGKLRTLRYTLGRSASPDYAATAAGFGAAGYGEDDLGGATGVQTGFGQDALSTAVGLDHAFKAASGTVAKFASQMATETNVSLTKGIVLVRDLGSAARESGLSFTGFLGAIMQSTSSLRLYNMETDGAVAIGNKILHVQKSLVGEGFTEHGAGQLAAAGMAGLANTVQGMDQGMKAVLGRRIGERMKKDWSGPEAIVKWERGFRGEGGKDMFDAQLAEMSEVLTSIGGSTDTQKWVAQNLFGMSPESADALMAMQKDIADGMGVEKASAKHQADVAKALKEQASREPLWKRLLDKATDGLARMAANALAATILGFQQIYHSIMWLGGLLGMNSEQKKTAYLAMNRIAPKMDAIWAGMSKGAGQFGEAAGSYFDMLSDVSAYSGTPTPSKPGTSRVHKMNRQALTDFMLQRVDEYTKGKSLTNVAIGLAKKRLRESILSSPAGTEEDLRTAAVTAAAHTHLLGFRGYMNDGPGSSLTGAYGSGGKGKISAQDIKNIQRKGILLYTKEEVRALPGNAGGGQPAVTAHKAPPPP